MTPSPHREDGGPAPQGAGRAAEMSLPAWIVDLFVCAGMAAVGLWFAIGSRSLPPGRTTIDPGTFPALVGWLLVGLSVAQALASFSHRRDGGSIATTRPGFVALGMAMVLLFPTAMQHFGYYVTAALWVPAFAWIAGMRQWLGFVVITAVILALARFVFEAILGTPLS